jgi:hypothetical protein
MTEGETANVSWSVRNCSKVTIAGPGIANGMAEMACVAYVIVGPSYSGNYTLTAYGPNGTQTAFSSISITVNPRPIIQNPVIDYFNASNWSIQQGETTSLQWSVRNCTQVTISGPTLSATMGCSNYLVVAPQYSANYVLTAYGANGQTASSTVWITVNPRPIHPPYPHYPPPYPPPIRPPYPYPPGPHWRPGSGHGGHHGGGHGGHGRRPGR